MRTIKVIVKRVIYVHGTGVPDAIRHVTEQLPEDDFSRVTITAYEQLEDDDE